MTISDIFRLYPNTELGEKEETISLITNIGHFQLYFLITGKNIRDHWYISIIDGPVNIEGELADVRVIMQDCYNKDVECKFIIGTNIDLKPQVKMINQTFDKMRAITGKNAEEMYELELWDIKGLYEKEKEFGIKIEL